MTCSGCQSTWTSGEECIPFHRIVLMSVRTWGLYSNYFTWPNVCIVSFGKWVVFLEGLIFRQACDLCELKTKQNSSFQKQWCNWILSSRPPWSGNSAQNNLTLGVCSQMNELMYLPLYLGDDLNRGMLQFAKGVPLGEKGLDWLKIHLVTLHGAKKKSSLQERLNYADEIMDDIMDSADNPLTVS